MAALERERAGKYEGKALEEEGKSTEDAAKGAYFGLEALRPDEMKHSWESSYDEKLSADDLGKATKHAMKAAQYKDKADKLRQQVGPASSSAGTVTSSGTNVGTSSGTDVPASAGGRAGSSTGASGNAASDDDTEDGDPASTAK
jgi:hypothetical protein